MPRQHREPHTMVAAPNGDRRHAWQDADRHLAEKSPARRASIAATDSNCLGANDLPTICPGSTNPGVDTGFAESDNVGASVAGGVGLPTR